jgi:hypothetical protein
LKKITLAVLLLLSAHTWAGGNPNPAEYTVNVHVKSSSIAGGQQDLSVVIDGKKYDLESETVPRALLALGDYKAKLIKDEHKTAYDSVRVYEFLFPDNKMRKFTVVGQTE